MKKTVSILLSVLIILPVIAAFGIGSVAEEPSANYKKLIEQKQEYIQNHYTKGY